MGYRSSFSQHSSFEKCSRMWYLEKVLKIPIVRDMSYANAGNAVHHTLQQYYDGKFSTLDETKEYFIKEWNKYKLPLTNLKFKKDEYWLMCLNGVKLAKKVTSTELKIYYPDCLCYIDIVNTEDDEISDWKTSRRDDGHDKDYKQQGMLYAWMYKRKFNRLIKKVIFNYLRYNGSKGEFVFVPTDDGIEYVQQWYYNILYQMEEIIKNKKLPPKCEECFVFCPFVDYCRKIERELVYNISYNGSTMYLAGPVSSILNNQLTKKFSYTLKNAYWIKKNNPHARTEVKFWNPLSRLLPIGFKYGLLKTLNDYGKHFKCKTIINHVENRDFNSESVVMPPSFINGRELRDYQIEAVEEFFKYGIGVLEMGTGSGKTEIAIEIIRRVGYKTLFLVDKIELLRQTKKRIEDSLGIEVGQVGGGVQEFRPVTVATIQTIIKHIREFRGYLSSIRLAIFDEVHHVASRSYVRVSQYLINTEYRLGISATNKRDDGNDMKIESVTGGKVFDLGSKILIEKGWLVQPTIYFIKDYMPKEKVKEFEEECKGELINETEKYPDFYNVFIKNNIYRNNLIKDIVDKHRGKKILILTKLIEHGQILNSMIEGSKHLYGGTNKKERKEMFDNFVSRNDNILISTISIWSEGLDCKPLKVIINAGANVGDVKTIQMLGRTLRILDGKKNALYYDFIDETRFFKRASFKRRKALISEGHEVEVVGWQENIKN